MSHPKTTLLVEDEDNGVFEKLWIVGEPNKKVLNYISESSVFNPINRNEEHGCRWYSTPKYFSTYAEARACAKFWNEKIPWKYDPAQKVARHGMNCAFKPVLVKVVIAK